MNIELRKEILEKSLIVEDALSGVLALLFRFPKDESKTLGHSSNSLSFKTKTDLLFDLKRLEDKQYKNLIMFMEIRNQLIHNLNTDTLLKATQRCQKTNRLLDINTTLKKEFNKTVDEQQKEAILNILIEELTQKLISIFKTIRENINNEIELENLRKSKEMASEFMNRCIKILGDSINKVSDVYDEVLIGEEIGNQSNKGLIKNLVWMSLVKELKLEYPDIVQEVIAEMKVRQD